MNRTVEEPSSSVCSDRGVKRRRTEQVDQRVSVREAQLPRGACLNTFLLLQPISAGTISSLAP